MSQRVLIVEDEVLVADDLEWQLTKLGYASGGIAASGEEAVAMAEASRPGIVLMDIQLQGRMSGTEAARIISKRTGAPIIFITAFAAVFLRDPSKMQRPGLCLSKPFSKVQLKAALETVAKQLH
jgi:CheY-like chemotaxis protein